MTTTTHSTTISSASGVLEHRHLPAIIAMVLGAGLIFTIGLVGADTVHNAAHDVRHAMTFPCH